MGARRGRLSSPWLRFHGGGAADVYIIIRVRASGCGESALNPPTSQPIPVEDLLPPRTATRTARAFSHPLPAHFSSPPPAPTHTRRLRHAFPAEDLRSPPLFRFGHKKNGTAQWMCDAFPADLTTHSPPKTFAHPRTATRPPRALPLPHAAPTHTRRLRDARPPTSRHIPRRRPSPADLTTHSSSKISSPPLLFRFGHKKTAPHSGCAMPNVSVDRRCGRSLGLVSRALFAAVAGHVACRRGA